MCNLINLQRFMCDHNQLNEIPIEIINCRNLEYFSYSNNEIIMNPIIQRFIDRMNKIKNHILYNDGQNIHTSSIQKSVRDSIITLLGIIIELIYS
jgi:Leucine-rich repeat (LRR) protein